MSRDLAASVRARLKQCADTTKQDFNLSLTHYGLERLLYRLSVSPHAANYLLKGALLFSLWYDQPHRPTREGPQSLSGSLATTIQDILRRRIGVVAKRAPALDAVQSPMTVPLAASLLDLVLGLQLGSSDKAAPNRCSLEGATWESGQDGVIEVRIRKLEAAALRLASGALVLEIGRIAVHELAGEVRIESGVPRLSVLGAADAEFSGVKLHGPVSMPPQLQRVRDALPSPVTAASTSTDTAPGQAAADAWCLGPLGEADGTIRGEITDAHLLFDADVTVPMRRGQIDFNDATVEHVGPDSRMGVSRLGFYVDAPNGRSYLYQFASAPLAGIEFERRGALLSPWVSERGKLRLQAFAESMLRQGLGGHGQGVTEQARLLLGRTALAGEVQLGDGRLAVPGLQVHIEGRSEGRNAVELRSEAVGSGLTVEMASLSARDAMAKWKGMRLACDEIAARFKLRLFVEGRQMRFVLELENGKAAGPRLDRRPAESV